MVLILRTRGRITERIQCEILESICDHWEGAAEELEDEEIFEQASDDYFASTPFPRPEYEASLATKGLPSDCHSWPRVPLLKSQKNRFILSMTQVCRSWRLNLAGSKRLWCEIAFSVGPKESVGIGLATLFLAKVADDDMPLHIYAGLPFTDAHDHKVGLLLSKLREKTRRWERFCYWGRLGPYRSYLDLPAPLLRHFSDHHDLCHVYLGRTQLFASHAPWLQSLTTSILGSWQPANLTNLRTLDIWDCAPRFSIASILGALRFTQQLEEMKIVSPSLPLIDCAQDEVVCLPHLKNLKVQNPDFYAIIGHFIIANADLVHLYSSSNRWVDGLEVGRAFEAAHPFVGFTSIKNLPPMLGKPVLTASLDLVDLDNTSLGFRFLITVTTGSGTVLCVDLEWNDSFSIDARSAYIKRSMSALAEMSFAPSSTLRVTSPARLVDYDSPLFRLDAVESLVVEGEALGTILSFLKKRSASSPLLPKLRYLFFPRDLLDDLLDEEIIGEVLEFLRSRKNVRIILASENRGFTHGLNGSCVIEGEFISLEAILASNRMKFPFAEYTGLVPTRAARPLIYVHFKGTPNC